MSLSRTLARCASRACIRSRTASFSRRETVRNRPLVHCERILQWSLWLHASLGLVDLKATDILGCRRVRRPPEKLSKAPHKPDIITLRVLPQAARRHVFEHPLAQRTHGL